MPHLGRRDDRVRTPGVMTPPNPGCHQIIQPHSHSTRLRIKTGFLKKPTILTLACHFNEYIKI